MLRAATAADAPLLEAMLLEAVNWDASRPQLTRAKALADPTVAHYVAGWPRAGDAGVVAEEDGVSLGAAWYRVFADDDRGYGFVDSSTPEVSIAVAETWRGRGVGTSLLRELHAVARSVGHRRLSLSVEGANPARELYERLGYLEVGVEGGSITMVVDL